MNFKSYVLLSNLVCFGLCSSNTIVSFGYFGIFETLGGLTFASIPAVIYLVVKRNKKKEGWTFFILQNFLALLSLVGNYGIV